MWPLNQPVVRQGDRRNNNEWRERHSGAHQENDRRRDYIGRAEHQHSQAKRVGDQQSNPEKDTDC